MAKVVKFYSRDAAKDPDNVLELAIGEYEHVLLLGIDKDGEIDFRSNSGMTDMHINWILDRFKIHLLTHVINE